MTWKNPMHIPVWIFSGTLVFNMHMMGMMDAVDPLMVLTVQPVQPEDWQSGIPVEKEQMAGVDWESLLWPVFWCPVQGTQWLLWSK